MMPASKHGDPQLGIDIHLHEVPPSPSPVPLPSLHVSVVFDPFDYLPVIGTTITVCGMRRANAGTGGITGHFWPPSFPFIPKAPDWTDVLFMGSKTVAADGEPFTFLGLPVLGCQMIGFPSIPRIKPKPSQISLLPTTFNLAIPTSVFIGGPPTISLMVLGFMAVFAVLGKFGKKLVESKFFQGKLQKFKKFLKCNPLWGHPVNILTGEAEEWQQDFTLPGRIPLQWERLYTSGNDYEGLCGYGWETPADTRLEVDPIDGAVHMCHPSEGPLLFGRLPIAAGDQASELELMDGALLTDHGDELRVRTKQDLTYHFPKALAHVGRNGTLNYPIGRIADLCGNWLDFERRGGVLVAINESAGRRIELAVVGGRIREVTLTQPGTGLRHSLVRYEYDAAGDLVAVLDALDHPYRFAYEQHRMVRLTKRNGLSFYYKYEQSGEDWRAIHAWGDDGLYDYRFEYIDTLNERRITDSLGNVTVITLDERGQPVCQLDPLGGKTVYQYDECGRTSAVIDPEGNATAWDYDGHGNQLCTTLPDGSRVSADYNADHKPVCVTDGEGGQWRQTWDSRGNLTGQITPGGAVMQYEYTGQGDLLRVTDPARQITTLHYDALGFLAGLSDPAGQRTHFECNAQGNLLRKQLANGDVTTYRYDAKSRLIEGVLPDAKRIQCAYDAEDELTRYTDEAGRITRFGYCGLSRLQSRTDPDGSRVEYHYDTEEQLIAVTNQRGQRWQLRRDAVGRLAEEIDYWGQSRTYAYDLAGRLTQTTDPLGQILTFTCDKLGRIVKKQASQQDAETYRYNKRGQLTGAKNPYSTIECQYDRDGQLTEEKQQQPDAQGSIAYAYNPAGQLVEQTRQIETAQTQFKQTQRIGYDALGQPESVQIDGHDPIRFTFDQIGRITGQQLSGRLAHHYRYNAAGRLAAQTSTLDGKLDTRIDYDYDDAGNLVQRRDQRLGTDQFRYDLLGQITAHTDPAGRVRQFVYDKTGDRFKTVQQDEQGRTLQHADGSFWRMDQAGQLTRRRDAQGRDTHLRWDVYGRLRHLLNPEQERYEYRYDALGRRICKIKKAASKTAPAEITCFLWDGDVMVGEVKQTIPPNAEPRIDWDTPANPNIGISNVDLAVDANTASQPPPRPQARFYTYHLNTFVPLAMQTQTPKGDGRVGKALYFYQNDPNGMPLRVVDEDGVIRWEGRYSAFGLVDCLGVGAVEQPLRLQGQYFDVESGLHYNRYRYYDGGVGCFVSADPIGLVGGLNPYQFAPNMLGWIDPFGLSNSTIPPVNFVAGPSGIVPVTPGFIVTPDGTAVEVSQARLRQSLVNANARYMGQTTLTSEVGEMWRLTVEPAKISRAGNPIPAREIDIRIMPGQPGGDPLRGPRTIFTEAGTNNYVHPSGQRITGNHSASQRRGIGHVHGQSTC